jgi:hypothetical protein
MESLNILDYGADPTRTNDSASAIQNALDDAALLTRGQASGSGSTLTVDGLEPSDVDQSITIERDLGLPQSAYPLRIGEVLSPSECTVKTAQGDIVEFEAFNDVLAIRRRDGYYGKAVAVPMGHYECSQSLQMLSDSVGLIGEQRPGYSDLAGSKLHFLFTTGIIQRSFLAADASWMPFGPGLVEGASTSYRLTPTEPGVAWDYQDSFHVETGLNGLTAFTLECFVKFVSTEAGAIVSLFGTLPDKGGEINLELSVVAENQLRAAVNLSGQTYAWGSTPIQTGTIYHLCLQFDGTTAAFLINGIIQGSANADGKSLVAAPWHNFQIGAWRNFPCGGTLYSAANCYLSHLRMSNVARYPVTGFTPPTAALEGDNNTLVLDEGSPSQHSLFLVDVGGASPSYGYRRVKINRHTLNNFGFMGNQRIAHLGLFSYGTGVYVRRCTGSQWDSLFLHSRSTAFLGSPDTFLNKMASVAVAGGRAGMVLAGPSGITSYDDIVVTSGKIGAWLRAGSGIIHDWYSHGNHIYQLILEDWEGSIIGSYLSSEDAITGTQRANLLIGGYNSDIAISGTKIETFQYARPSIEIGNIRAATIQAAFEPHADAEEIIRFIGTPKTKVVLLNPTHGRVEGVPPQGDVPWSVSAPSGKLEVI